MLDRVYISAGMPSKLGSDLTTIRFRLIKAYVDDANNILYYRFLTGHVDDFNTRNKI